MQLSDNVRGAVLMNVAMAAFTINDTAMKAAMQAVPLFQAIGIRGLVATLALTVIGYRLGGLSLNLPRRDLGFLAMRSGAEVLGTILFLAALMHMPIANLSAIMQVLPLAVTLAAALFLRERIGWRRMTAIVIGFAGVMIIIRPGTHGFDIWSVMGLGSVICVVVRDLVTRRMSASLPSVTVALSAAVTVLVLGLAGTAAQGWQPVAQTDLLLIAGAALALIVGYLTVVMTMRVGEISFIAPFRYMALLWAIVLGWLAFGELPDALTLIGAAIVVLTGVYTLMRERKLRLTGPVLAQAEGETVH
ncbi:DMT family transporter [Tabrizicola sp.]|uniref:DMT family transporter n=1 Tax=Tabrizicola sp. TaxID=2005166 RepID=UPI00286D1C28|nr:DMT family transporter [Tabrizicola sp.]